MPTRLEVHTEISKLTAPSYAEDVKLSKTNYKSAEANKLMLKALISFHELLLVDELLVKLETSTTNMSVETYRDYMRTIWENQRSMRTHAQLNIFTHVSDMLKGSTSIGRNQAIQILKDSIVWTLTK